MTATLLDQIHLIADAVADAASAAPAHLRRRADAVADFAAAVEYFASEDPRLRAYLDQPVDTFAGGPAAPAAAPAPAEPEPVTHRRRSRPSGGRSPQTAKAIRSYLAANPAGVKAKDVAEAIGCTRQYVNITFDRMRRAGQITRQEIATDNDGRAPYLYKLAGGHDGRE